MSLNIAMEHGVFIDWPDLTHSGFQMANYGTIRGQNNCAYIYIHACISLVVILIITSCLTLGARVLNGSRTGWSDSGYCIEHRVIPLKSIQPAHWSIKHSIDMGIFLQTGNTPGTTMTPWSQYARFALQPARASQVTWQT
jgi:hypothetical protein